MQNYNDIPQLAGLEEDLALKQEMEAKIVCCKALKCYYIALTYLNGQKWPEARALFQRATIYANKAKNDTIVPDSMREGKDLTYLIIQIFLRTVTGIRDRSRYGFSVWTFLYINTQF